MTVPIILDIEASGFGSGSYPIEIGFSGRHGEGWCSLIRPEAEWTHWDLDAARVHGIPREVLIERGNYGAICGRTTQFFSRWPYGVHRWLGTGLCVVSKFIRICANRSEVQLARLV